MREEGRDRWWGKKIEGNRGRGKMEGWRWRTIDRIRGGMINGRNEGIHLNVSMDFFVLTEYLVMSHLSWGLESFRSIIHHQLQKWRSILPQLVAVA